MPRYRVEVLFEARDDNDAVDAGREIVGLAAASHLSTRSGISMDERAVMIGDLDEMKARWDYNRNVLRNGKPSVDPPS